MGQVVSVLENVCPISVRLTPFASADCPKRTKPAFCLKAFGTLQHSTLGAVIKFFICTISSPKAFVTPIAEIKLFTVYLVMLSQQYSRERRSLYVRQDPPRCDASTSVAGLCNFNSLKHSSLAPKSRLALATGLHGLLLATISHLASLGPWARVAVHAICRPKS